MMDHSHVTSYPLASFSLSRENQIAKKVLNSFFVSDLTGCVKHTGKENQMTGTAQKKFVVKMKNKNLL
jgi:hypothetical protein